MPPIIATSLLVGVAIGVLVSVLDLPGGAATAAAATCVLLGIFWVWERRTRAGRVHRSLKAAARQGELPPDVAVRVDSPLARRWATKHVEETRALLTDDFTATFAGRTIGRRQWLAGQRATARLYPDLEVRLREVLADPEETSVLWVLAAQTGTPRSGPALHVECWERLELDAEDRVRSSAVRVERVA